MNIKNTCPSKCANSMGTMLMLSPWKHIKNYHSIPMRTNIKSFLLIYFCTLLPGLWNNHFLTVLRVEGYLRPWYEIYSLFIFCLIHKIPCSKNYGMFALFLNSSVYFGRQPPQTTTAHMTTSFYPNSNFGEKTCQFP